MTKIQQHYRLFINVLIVLSLKIEKETSKFNHLLAKIHQNQMFKSNVVLLLNTVNNASQEQQQYFITVIAANNNVIRYS